MKRACNIDARRKAERWAEDADHGMRLAFHHDLLPNDARVRVQSAVPEIVSEHDKARIRMGIVAGEPASKRRLDPEQPEEVRSDLRIVTNPAAIAPTFSNERVCSAIA